MRSSIITLVLLLSIGVSWAGDRNRIIALGVRNFTYTPKEGKETVGSALGSIANVLITGQNTTQQPQYKAFAQSLPTWGILVNKRMPLLTIMWMQQ